VTQPQSGDGAPPEAAEPPADAGASAAPPQKGKIARNIVVLMGSQVITWGLALVLTTVEPRYLGPEGVGQIRLAISLWAIINVFAELGTSTLLTLQFARDPKRAAALLRPVLKLRVTAEMLGWIAILVIVLAAGYDKDTAIVIALVGLGLNVTIVAETARASLYGLQRMGAAARVDVITKVVTVVLIVLVLVLGGRAEWVAIAMLVAAIVSCVLMWIPVRHEAAQYGGQQGPPAFAVMKMGSPFLLGSAVQIVYGSIDVVIISLLATEDEIGWYATAATLFGSLLFVPTVLMTSLFPALAQIHEQRPEALDELLRRAFRSMLLLAVPMGLGTIIVCNQVAELLFGDDFAEAGPVLGVFGIVIILEFQTILFGRFAFATGRHAVFNTVMIVATIATVPLDLVLVPWTHRQFDNGAIGGALSYVVTESIIFGYGVFKLAPQLLNGPTLVRLVKSGIAGGAMMAAGWPLRDMFLLLPISVGAIVFIGVALVVRLLDENEREMAGKAWSKIRRRSHDRSLVVGEKTAR
jgi:O-antigen/teichoic acid export membrane protein